MARPPLPGARVELFIPPDDAPGTRYRWLQVTGPPVPLDDPTKATIAIVVPKTTGPLVFLRLGLSRDKVRVVRVEVPTGEGANGSPAGAPPAGSPMSATTPARPLRADAGDDQVGLVGHRVTLNGSRSRPSERLIYRWLQLSGPPIASPQQDRAFYSFIPSSPGVYRMALIVGESGQISEPEEVTVLVGVLPPGLAGATGPSPSAPASPAAIPIPTPGQILRPTVPNLPGGRAMAREIAVAFDFLAGRASLYSSFAEIQRDLGRRLDAIIPAEAVQRQAWSQAVFQPLTTYTAHDLLTSGLDIRQPAAVNGNLTPAQKDRIQEHLKAVAEAFRAISASE